MLNVIEVSESLLTELDLVEEGILGCNLLDMVVDTVPIAVINDLREHCRKGLNSCYILNLRLNENVYWLNVKFLHQARNLRGSAPVDYGFEVRFFQIDKFSIRNVQDMYILMNSEALFGTEQKQHSKVISCL